MTLFWLASALMVALVLAVLLPPLLGGGGERGFRRRLLAARGELAALRAERERGTLDQEGYAEGRRRLADALLVGLLEQPAGPADSHSRGLALVLALLLPAAAFGLYAYLGAGNTALRAERALALGGEAGNPAGQSLDSMIQRLEARLQAEPEDAQGWGLLGQSYLAQGRFAEAEAAYARAYELEGEQPALLVRYAEAMARARDGDLTGRPSELLERALELAPEDELALWYGGLAAYQGGQPERTLSLWRQLLAMQAPASDAARAIGEQLARIQAESGAVATVAQPAAAPAGAASGAAVTGPALEVRVSLSPTLVAPSDPGATLFVYARAADGPKAPLALVRQQAGALPVTVRLSDAEAMLPQMTLSRFPQVEVVARITASGQASPQSGDLIGVSGPIDQGKQQGPVAVVISEVVE